MKDHSRIEELIAALVLRGLDPDDEAALAREMAGHGPDCAECRRLEREFSEVAGRLGFALDPEPVRAGLEDKVVAEALGTPQAAAAAPSGQPVPRRRARMARGLVTVAAAVAIFFAGWLVRGVTAPEAAFAGAHVAPFEGSAGDMAILYRPDEKGVVLIGSGLSSPEEGHVYELWRIRGQTPIATACFTPGAGGMVVSFIDAAVNPRDVMAVTVEPSSCPDSPTTAPILTTDPLTV